MESSTFLGSSASAAGIASFFIKPSSPATSLAISHTALDESPAPTPYTTAPKEASPIFTQFLECVAVLLKRFPAAFAFNEALLVALHDEVYSCRFGTFLTNHEWEKETCRIVQRTHSVWDYLLARREAFLNPRYACSGQQPAVLDLRIEPRVTTFGFWRRLYLRWVEPRQTDATTISPFAHGYALRPVRLFDAQTTPASQPPPPPPTDYHVCSLCQSRFLFYDHMVFSRSIRCVLCD
jgi:hypothetical protein